MPLPLHRAARLTVTTAADTAAAPGSAAADSGSDDAGAGGGRQSGANTALLPDAMAQLPARLLVLLNVRQVIDVVAGDVVQKAGMHIGYSQQLGNHVGLQPGDERSVAEMVVRIAVVKK